MSDETMDFGYRTHETFQHLGVKASAGMFSVPWQADPVLHNRTCHSVLLSLRDRAGAGSWRREGRDPPSPLAASPYFVVKFYSTEA